MRTLLAIAILFVCTSAAQASARTVTLLGISGPGGERFADLLEQDLSDLYDFIEGEVYRSSAERLGKSGASPGEVEAVARALRIDAIVGGAITGSGRQRVLSIAVRSGRTGQVSARGRYDLSEQTLPLVREKVVRDLVRAFDRVSTEPSSTEKVADGAREETLSEAPQKASAATADSDSMAKPLMSLESSRGLVAGVGVTVFSRRLVFGGVSAPGYASGAVAGVHADIAVFPFALSRELADAHPVLASFGLLGSYDRAFSFNSTSATGTVAAQASRWHALFVGRIPLGHAAKGGYLSLETGLAELSWSSDSPLALGVPDVRYDFIDAGLAWDRNLGTRKVALALRVAYLGLVDSGGITSDAEYGHARASGIEASAALTVRPVRWLWLRLEGQYTPVFVSFAQSGTRYARSATEQWASGVLEVGFAL